MDAAFAPTPEPTTQLPGRESSPAPSARAPTLQGPSAPAPPPPPPEGRRGNLTAQDAAAFAQHLAEHAEALSRERQDVTASFEEGLARVALEAPLGVDEAFVRRTRLAGDVVIEAELAPLESQIGQLDEEAGRRRRAVEAQAGKEPRPAPAEEDGGALDGIEDRVSALFSAGIDLLRTGLEVLAQWCAVALERLEQEGRRALDGLQAKALPALLAELRAESEDPWGPVVRVGLLAAGLPPDTLSLFGRSREAAEAVMDDPVAFARNAASAVGAGFTSFGENIGTHLKQGISEWLGAELGIGGIDLPERWDAKGFLQVAGQVLGITEDTVMKAIGDEVGEENAAALKEAGSALGALWKGGLDGLWEQVAARASDIVPTALEALREYVAEEVVLAGAMRLAKMWIPGYGVWEALTAAWKLFTWVRERLVPIVDAASGLLEQVEALVAGQIQGTATILENALAHELPGALGLLSRLLGLSGLFTGISHAMKSLRDWVEDGIRTVVRVVKTFLEAPLQLLRGEDPPLPETPPEMGLGDSPDRRRVEAYLRRDGKLDGEGHATREALLRHGRRAWRQDAGSDHDFLVDVAREIGGPVGQRKLREVAREEQPAAAREVPTWEREVADLWIGSLERGDEALYLTMQKPASRRKGLGTAVDTGVDELHRAMGADSLWKYHVPKEKGDTFDRWARRLGDGQVPTSNLKGSLLAGTWWTPDDRAIREADGSSTEFEDHCLLLALAPEWFPRGTVTLTVSTEKFDLVRPTVWDGMMSPLWVQPAPGELSATGGGLPEFIERGSIPANQIDRIEASGLVTAGMTRALQEAAKLSPAEQWTEDGRPTGPGAEDPDVQWAAELQGEVSNRTRQARAAQEGLRKRMQEE